VIAQCKEVSAKWKNLVLFYGKSVMITVIVEEAIIIDWMVSLRELTSSEAMLKK